MLSVYPACFYKEENGYSVIFPDLNWLATQGDTLQEAMGTVSYTHLDVYKRQILASSSASTA